jgi:hypothetical protein
MPVATDIVPGQRADDPLYIPAITRVREGLGRRGLLYVGDCTMGALETRAYIPAGGDDDLGPLSERHLPPAVLADYLVPVWAEEQILTVIHRAQPGGQSKLIAEGFERLEPVTAEVAGHRYSWLERRLVIRSCQLAQAAERGLRGRLAKAQAGPAKLHRAECPAGGGRCHPGPLSGAWPVARPGQSTTVGATLASLRRPGRPRASGVGRQGDRQC